MQPVKFRYVILNSSFEKQKQLGFFTCRESLDGKNMSDICLNDPVAILEALKSSKDQVIDEEEGLIDDILQGQNHHTIGTFSKYGIK